MPRTNPLKGRVANRLDYCLQSRSLKAQSNSRVRLIQEHSRGAAFTPLQRSKGRRRRKFKWLEKSRQ